MTGQNRYNVVYRGRSTGQSMKVPPEVRGSFRRRFICRSRSSFSW